MSENYLKSLILNTMSELTDFLNFLLSSLVDSTDYQLSQSEQNGVINYTLQVKPEKAGLIIGREGRTIKAIRRLLQIKASQQKLHVYLQVNSNPPLPQEEKVEKTEADKVAEVKEEPQQEVTSDKTENKVEELSDLIADTN